MNKSPDLTRATNTSMNKNMGATQSPVHSMSLKELEDHYRRTKKNKSEEYKKLKDDSTKMAKGLGILGAGLAIVSSMTPVAPLLCAIPLLGAIYKGAQALDAWEMEGITSQQSKEGVILGELTEFAKEQGIEIDQAKTDKEAYEEFLGRSVVGRTTFTSNATNKSQSRFKQSVKL